MKYEFTSRVRYSETGENGKLTIPALINYFQDCSTFQSDAVGDGLDVLRAKNRAWILAYWQIELVRMPALFEEVTAATWAYEFKDFFGLRNFTLADAQGKFTAKANSVWVYFDVKNQRPAIVSEEEAFRYEPQERLEMPYKPRKIRIPAGLPAKEGDPFTVGIHQLDTNHHMNNGQYIQAAAQYFPRGCEISGIRAEYRRQARLHDRIIPVIYEQEPGQTDPHLPGQEPGHTDPHLPGREPGQTDPHLPGQEPGHTGPYLPGQERVILVSLNAEDGKPYCVTEFRTTSA